MCVCLDIFLYTIPIRQKRMIVYMNFCSFFALIKDRNSLNWLAIFSIFIVVALLALACVYVCVYCPQLVS